MNLPPTLLYEKRDRVAIITLNRPEAMNALTSDMLRGMDAAFDAFNTDPDLWVAIFTAAGDKSFCAGMDLKEAIPLLQSGDATGRPQPSPAHLDVRGSEAPRGRSSWAGALRSPPRMPVGVPGQNQYRGQSSF